MYLSIIFHLLSSGLHRDLLEMYKAKEGKKGEGRNPNFNLKEGGGGGVDTPTVH